MSENNFRTEEKICGLCSSNSSKYCCPRCDILYCSLNCYKSEKHLQCSESFYRDCVNEELKLQQIDEDDAKKIHNILQKVNESDTVDGFEDQEYLEYDSDDDIELDLHSRLKGLNLDNADDIWNALTEDERNEFEALLHEGDVTSIVPHWEPWWIHFREKPLVEDVSNIDEEDDKNLKKCPKIKAVPKFETLTSVQPSPAISFNITNVLASYAFIVRYFNGEVDAIEATTYLLDICCNLNKNVNYEDAEMAVEGVAQRCLLSEHIETDKNSLEIMRNDTFQILRGPSDDNIGYYSKAALSHIIQILTEAKSGFKKTKVDKSDRKKSDFSKKFPDHENYDSNIDKSKLGKTIKKVEFYLSFLNSCDSVCNQT